MGCVVSKLFLDFYIFFIFTRPLSVHYAICFNLLCTLSASIPGAKR